MSAYLFADNETKTFSESYSGPGLGSQCGFSWWEQVDPLTEPCESPLFIGGKGRRIKPSELTTLWDLVVVEPETTGFDFDDERIKSDQKQLLGLIEYCIHTGNSLYCMV